MLYQYIKSPPHAFRTTKRSTSAFYKSAGTVEIFFPTVRQRSRKSTALSFLLMTVGSGVLVWVLWPIVSFVVYTAPLFPKVVSPVSQGQSFGSPSFLSPLAVAADTGITPSPIDTTNANTWFPTSPQKKVVTPVNTYSLSIPKLGITDARVIIAGDDLAKSLVHYGGTGLPGEYGTTVIFGHSVLPQFFDPKNYKTIFSTLPTLKTGDDIVVTYDGVTYRYQVYELVVTEPNDLSSLEQNFSDSFLTLITCVPPGTYWKRLNVRARLVPS